MEGKEILAVVDSVSSEKGLEKDVIFVAMELAIASASQRHFHEDAQLIVEVDRGSGEFITKRQWKVLDENDEEVNYYEDNLKPNSIVRSYLRPSLKRKLEGRIIITTAMSYIQK